LKDPVLSHRIGEETQGSQKEVYNAGEKRGEGGEFLPATYTEKLEEQAMFKKKIKTEARQ